MMLSRIPWVWPDHLMVFAGADVRTTVDLSTMEHKLETYQYQSVEAFATDAQLVFDNCRLYNPEGSIYSRNATKLEKFFKDQLSDRVKREE